MNGATPLTPPSAWAELHFQMYYVTFDASSYHQPYMRSFRKTKGLSWLDLCLFLSWTYFIYIRRWTLYSFDNQLLICLVDRIACFIVQLWQCPCLHVVSNKVFFRFALSFESVHVVCTFAFRQLCSLVPIKLWIWYTCDLDNEVL